MILHLRGNAIGTERALYLAFALQSDTVRFSVHPVFLFNTDAHHIER
jgi:hypothetical protein